MGLADIPEEERPREKMLQKGVESLSLAELIAILLATGTKGKSVLILAEELLHKFHGLEGLLQASISELLQIKGVGKAKAIQLKAAFGIALKRSKAFLPEKYKIHTPQEAYELAKVEIGEEEKEVALVILRDAKGGLIHRERISVGTLSEVLIHPREVFYPAVKHKAHSLIIAHNHPSGDPTPSVSDLELTKILIHSSRVMGIALDDHLIIGKNRFISLRERGYLGAVKQRYS